MTTWTDPTDDLPADPRQPDRPELLDQPALPEPPSPFASGAAAASRPSNGEHQTRGEDASEPPPRQPPGPPDGTLAAPPTGRPHEPPPAARRLTRSNRSRVVGGVCGGIAEYTGIDVTVVRLLALLFMAMGQGIVLYLGAWLLMPGPEGAPSAFDAWRERRRR